MGPATMRLGTPRQQGSRLLFALLVAASAGSATAAESFSSFFALPLASFVSKMEEGHLPSRDERPALVRAEKPAPQVQQNLQQALPAQTHQQHQPSQQQQQQQQQPPQPMQQLQQQPQQPHPQPQATAAVPKAAAAPAQPSAVQLPQQAQAPVQVPVAQQQPPPPLQQQQQQRQQQPPPPQQQQQPPVPQPPQAQPPQAQPPRAQLPQAQVAQALPAQAQVTKPAPPPAQQGQAQPPPGAPQQTAPQPQPQMVAQQQVPVSQPAPMPEGQQQPAASQAQSVQPPAAEPQVAQVDHRQAQQQLLRKEHKLTSRSWFAVTFSFAFVVKALCILSNVLFQVSPYPQVRQFEKTRDTGEADSAPLISILYGGIQWCFYGVFAWVVTGKSGFLVLVYSNIAGAVLGVYYMWGFQRNCNNKKTLQLLFTYYKVSVGLTVLQIVAIWLVPRPQALFFCGFVSSVCSVLGACSILTTLPTVLETKCSGTINIELLVTGVGSSVLWLLCGILLWDIWIIVPNLLSIVCQSFAVAAVLYFPYELPAGRGGGGSPTSAASCASGKAGAGSQRLVDEARILILAAKAAAAASSSRPATASYGAALLVGETGGTA